jgi:hypothetical protein
MVIARRFGIVVISFGRRHSVLVILIYQFNLGSIIGPDVVHMQEESVLDVAQGLISIGILHC